MCRPWPESLPCTSWRIFTGQDLPARFSLARPLISLLHGSSPIISSGIRRTDCPTVRRPKKQRRNEGAYSISMQANLRLKICSRSMHCALRYSTFRLHGSARNRVVKMLGGRDVALPEIVGKPPVPVQIEQPSARLPDGSVANSQR